MTARVLYFWLVVGVLWGRIGAVCGNPFSVEDIKRVTRSTITKRMRSGR